MGRLFWKLFFGFWLTLLLTALAVGTALNLHRQSQESDDESAVATGPAAAMLVDSGASVLQYGGVEALRTLMQKWEKRPRGSRLYAVDTKGEELLRRRIPSEAYADALELAEHARQRQAARWVSASGKAYLLFVALPEGRSATHHRASPPLLPPAIVMLIAGVVASIGFAALLAWYLSRPIRHLRWAFDNAAQGKLDVRVQERIGKRRDEIADLGLYFDRMAQRLQRLLEGQQRLLHDVSHELRSPLARLQAAIGLARQNPARTEAMLERMEQETERVDHLVGELLTLSRLDTETNYSRIENVDVIELIGAIAEDARFEAQASGRDVHFLAKFEWQATVHVDALQRAIENVVRNAVKYTAEGTTVEITAQSGDPAKDLCIQVCDRGPGVPEADLEKIFEPFYRGDHTRSIDGFGLGLAIARRAIEADKGTIRAFNRKDGGLCVEIRLVKASPSKH